MLGLMLAFFVIVVWGITFVSTKALLGAGFSAFEILFIRYLMAYIVLWLLCPRKLRAGSLRNEIDFALAGLSGVGVYQLLENMAIHYTNASNVSIIVAICPMLTGIMAWLIYHEKALTLKFIIGFILAIGGVVLVCTSGVSQFHLNPIGDLMALAAAICWACYSTLLTRINSRGYNFLASTRRIFFWAVIFMIPLVIFGATIGKTCLNGSFTVDLCREVNIRRFTSGLNWMNLSFLGLLASAACFVAWNKTCSLLGTVRATVGIYLIPVVTLVFAYAFLGERLSFLGTIGTVLTIVGVAVSSMPGKNQ